MYRFIICLPLCLLFAPNRPEFAPADYRPPPPNIVSKEAPPIEDPLQFLEKCLERYEDQRIQGYRCTLMKQERIGGELKDREEIQVTFREKPHSVVFQWQRGARRAASALYVEGENDGKMLVHPSGLAGALVKVVSRDVDGADAKQAGRYTLKESGMKNAVQKTLKAWKAARDKADLQVEYLGIRKVRETGDRLCYAFRRTSKQPEEDGIIEGTFYIDKETWLQVGSVLKDKDNNLIGEYIFRDIQINPKFTEEQFKRDALLPSVPSSK